MNHHWTQEDDAAIVSGMAAGKSNAALAKELGLTRAKINLRCSILRRAGVAIPKYGKRAAPIDVAALNALIETKREG